MGSGFSRKFCPSAQDSWQFLTFESKTCSLGKALPSTSSHYPLIFAPTRFSAPSLQPTLHGKMTGQLSCLFFHPPPYQPFDRPTVFFASHRLVPASILARPLMETFSHQLPSFAACVPLAGILPHPFHPLQCASLSLFTYSHFIMIKLRTIHTKPDI